MSFNLDHYYSQLKEMKAKLAAEFPHGVVPLVSIEHYDLNEHKTGVLTEAHIATAARMVVKRTHRVADETEVARYKQELAERTEQYRAMELERKAASGQLAIMMQSAPIPQSVVPAPAPEPKKETPRRQA
jgi:hypothetical protein